MKSAIRTLAAILTLIFATSSAEALIIACKVGPDNVSFHGSADPQKAVIGSKVLRINGIERNLHSFDYSETTSSIFDYDFSTSLQSREESSSQYVTARFIQVPDKVLRNFVFDLSMCSSTKKSRVLIYDRDITQVKLKKIAQGLCVCQ